MSCIYPETDIRYLLSVNASSEKIINSMSLEPFPELLSYWSQIGKPKELLHTFQKGIERAVGNNRYPIYLLDKYPAPEFAQSIRAGLLTLLLKCRYTLCGNKLYIDSRSGEAFRCSDKVKQHILTELFKGCTEIDLDINSRTTHLHIVTSDHVAQICKTPFCKLAN